MWHKFDSLLMSMGSKGRPVLFKVSIQRAVLFILLCSINHLSEAKTQGKTLKDVQKKEASQGKPLRIQGVHAKSLKIEPSKKLKITGAIETEKEKDHLLLILEDQAQAVVKTPAQSLSIVLQSLENLEIKDFKKANIKISLKQAKVLSQNNQGDMQIHLDEGRLEIQSHKGSINMHSYLAPVFLENLKGSLKISALRSPLNISRSQGTFDIQSFSGPIQLEKLKGHLTFHAEKSKIQFKSYKGSIQGYSRQGGISGSMTPDQVKIESWLSPIHLYFANSKARIEAQSWEGKVLAPKNFYKDRAGGVYKAFGSIRHRGDVPGNVHLKSRYGKISIL